MTSQTWISTLLASALFISAALAQASATPLTNDDAVAGMVTSASAATVSTPTIEQPVAVAESEAVLPPGPAANVPAAPAKKKRSWLKALASPTVGQVLVTAASQFANQADPFTGQVKSTVLARVTGIASSLMNGQQPTANLGVPVDQGPGMMVPYAGAPVQNAPVPMMMVPAYGYAPQCQPTMMQPIVMPGAAPAGIPPSNQPMPQPAPVIMNVHPNVIAGDSTAQITVINGQAMVRVVSPDGQTVLLPLNNRGPHEAPATTQNVGGAREVKNPKTMSHQ